MSQRIEQLLIVLLAAVTCCVFAIPAEAAVATGSTEPTKAPGRYELRERRPGEESIFDITFGSPPPMATERGILIIDAFNDLNNNQRQDDNEQELIDEITCRLDGIDYLVPAFIPGLEYNDSYSITCDGKTYLPSGEQPEVFIEKRGQIIRLNIPCRSRIPTPQTDSD